MNNAAAPTPDRLPTPWASDPTVPCLTAPWWVEETPRQPATDGPGPDARIVKRTWRLDITRAQLMASIGDPHAESDLASRVLVVQQLGMSATDLRL